MLSDCFWCELFFCFAAFTIVAQLVAAPETASARQNNRLLRLTQKVNVPEVLAYLHHSWFPNLTTMSAADITWKIFWNYARLGRNQLTQNIPGIATPEMRARSGRSEIPAILIDFPPASLAFSEEDHASEPFEGTLHRLWQEFLSRARTGRGVPTTTFSDQEQVLSATVRMDQSLIVVQSYFIFKGVVIFVVVFMIIHKLDRAYGAPPPSKKYALLATGKSSCKNIEKRA